MVGGVHDFTEKFCKAQQFTRVYPYQTYCLLFLFLHSSSFMVNAAAYAEVGGVMD